MKIINIKYWVLSLLILSCKNKNLAEQPVAIFRDGKLSVQHKTKQVDASWSELTVRTKFSFSRAVFSTQVATHFQYELGKNMRLLLNADTIQPSLFYYVPLINKMEKEIDVQFLIPANSLGQTKFLIIQDTLQEFNKLKVSFK